MRRIIIALAGAAAGLLLGVSIASADGGPHGDYTTTTDKCAACHRVHTAQGAKVLKADRAGICLSCHDGSGAPLDVWDGVRLAAFTVAPGNNVRPIDLLQSPISGALRGGGFVYARIDSGNPTAPGAALANTAAGQAVTSAHVKFGTAGSTGNGLTPNNVIWGNGAIGSGTGLSITASPLACMDCHNPHGNGNYRILRPIPRQSGAGSNVIVPDEATKNYTTDNYWLQYQVGGTGHFSDAARSTTVSQWCSQCHTRYLAGPADATTPSGDPIFTYRHRSNAAGTAGNGWVGATYGSPGPEFRPFCLQCHVSHGSNADMSGQWSSAVPWPGGTTGRGNESTLLKINNRGTCVACHGTQPGT